MRTKRIKNSILLYFSILIITILSTLYYSSNMKDLYIALLFSFLMFGSYANSNQFQMDSVYAQESDSLTIYYHGLYTKAIEVKDTLQQIEYLQKMGTLYSKNENFDEGLDCISEALFLSEQKGLIKEQSKLLGKLGILHFQFGDIETASNYVWEALHIRKQLVKEQKIAPSELLQSYMNIIEIERRKHNNTSALNYLDTCFMLANSYPIPKSNLVNVYRMKASILTAMDSLEQAIQILIPLEHYYDTVQSSSSFKSANLGSYILVSSLMGRIYSRQEKNALALRYFHKSLNLIKDLHDKTDHQSHVLCEIAKLYGKKGQFDLAFEYLMEAWEYSTKHLTTTSERNKGVLTVRNRYKEKLDGQEKELMAQNLVLVEKEQAILRFRLLLSFILIIVATSIFVIWSRINKNKQARLSEKAQHIQLQLESKNKELTTYALQLMERDDLLDKFTGYLNNDKSNEAKSLKTSRKHLLINTWEEFEKRFAEINEGFYDRLSEQFPELTIGDLRYCALLKLNLRGKEISKLLGITEKSVHMARYRIRKKFDMQTDANLVKFLNQI